LHSEYDDARIEAPRSGSKVARIDASHCMDYPIDAPHPDCMDDIDATHSEYDDAA